MELDQGHPSGAGSSPSAGLRTATRKGNRKENGEVEVGEPEGRVEVEAGW